MNSLLSQKSMSSFRTQLILDGIIVGFLSGLISIAYRYTISQMDFLRHWLYQSKDILWLLLILGLILIITYVLTKLLEWAPFSNGSGIPQIKAEILDRIHPAPLPIIISKFIGGSLNNLLGYSVGREGPSIQMGGDDC